MNLKKLFLTAFGFSTLALSSQTNVDTLKVLFVGNSYTFTYNMPQLVQSLSTFTTKKISVTVSAVGGTTLENHWKGEKGLKTKDIIKNNKFDVVVIQEHSMGTIDKKDDFLNYSKKLIDLVKETGAKPILYTTWARYKVPQYQETITKTYNEAGQLNGVDVLNVGEYWKKARMLRPDLQLFVEDGSHPSHMGAFLTANIFVQKLTGETPKKLPEWFFVDDANNNPIMLFWADALDITFCVKLAGEKL